MSKVSLANHADHPHIPSITSPNVDSQCGGCPLAQTGGHKSCSSFKASTPAPIASRMEGERHVSMQWMMHRLGQDFSGPPGIVGHSLNLYQGESTSQFAYFSNWNVVSVNGSEIVLEEPSSSDPRSILLFQYSTENPLNPLINITGYYVRGSLQPGMVLQFSDNSVLSFKNLPTIVKVMSFDVPNHRVTLKLDKTVSNALTYTPTGSGQVSVNIWHFYAYVENWQFHIEPDIFYGIRRSTEIDAVDVPTDGLIILNDGPVMHPGGWDPSLTTWEISARRIDTGLWEDVSDQNNRLFVTPTESSVALKTTKPSYGVASITLTDDLTTIYNRFLITYWEYNDGSAQSCKPLGYARCKFSKPDPSGSSSAFSDGGANAGFGVDGLCTIRIQTDNSDTQDTDSDGYDDTVFPVDFSPSGVSRFPLNRLCLQHNSCDGWQAAEGHVGRDDNWITQEHAGNFYREIWGANDIVLTQLVVGAPDEDSRIKRSMHPSLYSVSGYFGITTPAMGDHADVEFPVNGILAKPYQYSDGTGTHIGRIWNAFHGLQDPSDYNSNIDGAITSEVTDFKTTRNPTDATTTISERDIERIGFGVEKDDGAMTGRGLSQSTVALPAQTLLVSPNVNIITFDELQESAVASFERKSGGFAAEILVFPLRQSVKSGVNIGSRTVHSVSDLGGGLYRIELENEQHAYGTYSSGATTIVNWEGGGVPPIMPFPGQEINNYHSLYKTTGTRARGAWKGDSIGYDGHYFVINDVLPHGGSDAGTWNGTTPLDGYSINQDYTSFGSKRDYVDVYDENSIIVNFTGGETITFHWQEAIAMPGAILEWTEYQTDNWQVVEDATFWHGEGMFKITDTWFTDKPDNICFRATNFKWLDHRGAIPASLHNKTYDAIMRPWECFTLPGGGYGGSVCIGSFKRIHHSRTTTEVSPGVFCDDGGWEADLTTEGTGCGSTNSALIYSGPAAPDVHNAETEVGISSVGGQAIGWPYVFQCIPSNSTVISVKAEVSFTGLVRTVTDWTTLVENCDGSTAQAFSDNSPATSYEGLTVSFARITGPDPEDYTIIGAVDLPASSSSESLVVDVTDIYQTIFSDVDSNALGYTLVVLPESVFGASLDELMPDPPPLVSFDSSCDADGCDTGYELGTYYSDQLEWDTCSITSLWVEVEYHDDEKTRQVLLFRWPDGGPVTP